MVCGENRISENEKILLVSTNDHSWYHIYPYTEWDVVRTEKIEEFDLLFKTYLMYVHIVKKGYKTSVDLDKRGNNIEN